MTLNYHDVPLVEVIEDLRAVPGVNIYIDAVALAEHGISLDRPITIEVADVSLESALKLLLQPLHLTSLIKDDLLQITTEPRGGPLASVTYDVSDLVVKKPRTTWDAEASEEETLMRLSPIPLPRGAGRQRAGRGRWITSR